MFCSICVRQKSQINVFSIWYFALFADYFYIQQGWIVQWYFINRRSLLAIDNRKTEKIKFSFGFIALTTCLYIAILPKIDSISGGAIVNRLSDQSVESRKVILRSELIAFRENPILGIGPGMSRVYRIYNFNDPKHTHTEYTRLLAEHGIFGLFVIVLLIVITFKSFKSNESISKSI